MRSQPRVALEASPKAGGAVGPCWASFPSLESSPCYGEASPSCSFPGESSLERQNEGCKKLFLELEVDEQLQD